MKKSKPRLKIKQKKSKGSAKLKKKEKKLKPIARVTHYYGKIKVAVVKILTPFKKGIMVRVIGGEKIDFEQKIESMQLDHKMVALAKRGKSVGIKLKKKVKKGYKLFKA